MNTTAPVNLEGIRAPTVRALRSLAANPRVDEIENANMDPGRFFVHLKAPWRYTDDPHSTAENPQRTKSFSGAGDAARAVNAAKAD